MQGLLEAGSLEGGGKRNHCGRGILGWLIFVFGLNGVVADLGDYGLDNEYVFGLGSGAMLDSSEVIGLGFFVYVCARVWTVLRGCFRVLSWEKGAAIAASRPGLVFQTRGALARGAECSRLGESPYPLFVGSGGVQA